MNSVKVIVFNLIILLTLLCSCEQQLEEPSNISNQHPSLEFEVDLEPEEPIGWYLKVGEFNQHTGAIDILTEKLVKHLSNGTAVDNFAISITEKKFRLIRFAQIRDADYAFETAEVIGVPKPAGGPSSHTHDLHLKVNENNKLKLTAFKDPNHICQMLQNPVCHGALVIGFSGIHIENDVGEVVTCDDVDEGVDGLCDNSVRYSFIGIEQLIVSS